MTTSGIAASQLPELSNTQRRRLMGWLPPWSILTLFTFMMILTYFDRGVFATALTNVQDQLHLNNSQAGLQGSLFMAGYVVSSVIFANLANSMRPLRLMAFGLSVWVLSVAGTGLSFHLVEISIARALTGVGEASFLCIAPSFINQVAPPDKKSLWLSVFYTAIPLGYALGYILSGSIISSDVFGEDWTWRAVFILEGLLIIPCIILLLTLKGPRNFSEIDDNHEAGDLTPFQQAIEDIQYLVKNRTYMATSLGYAMQTFFVGGVAFFGVNYTINRLGEELRTASTWFGLVTLLAGLIGTSLGGYILDYLRRNNVDSDHLSLISALKMMSISALFMVPLAVLIFTVTNTTLFFLFMFIGQTGAFLALSPTNSALLWAVPLRIQPFAMAVSVMFVHILGDAISPSIIGGLLDHTNEDWELCMLVLSSPLILSLLFWSYGYFHTVRRAPDSYERLPEDVDFEVDA